MRRSTILRIGEEAICLGFKKSSHPNRWILAGNDVTISIEVVDEKEIFLVASKEGLKERLSRPTTKDFGTRLRKKLTAFRKKAIRLSKRRRREKRRSLAEMVTNSRKEKGGGEEDKIYLRASLKEILEFDPLDFCRVCRRMTRQSFMKTEDVCLGCWTEESPKRKLR